jgi:hypothetical protein
MKPQLYEVQIRLFEQIKYSLPENVSLIDELRTVLNMSDNSIYRRISGETELTLSEAELLSTVYGISLDALCSYKGNTVVFEFHPMKDEKDFLNYLFSITRNLEKICRNKNAKVIYAGEDIPLFYNFGSDELAKFKYFYWMKFVMNVKSFEHVKYNPDLISDDIVKAGMELSNQYARLTTIEIWTDATALSLFKQILYLWESGQFESKEVALAVCDAVRQVFSSLEEAATLGYKIDSDGNRTAPESIYQLYYSETEIGNNCILTDVEGEKTVYLAFNTFNKLSTRQRFFCDVTESWLQTIISRSTLISGVSEKRRLQFFKKLYNGLDDLRKKIEDGEEQ